MVMILVYLTCNEGNSVVAQKFIRTLKSKTYKRVTAYNNKSYLDYFNKSVDEYNNSYYHCIGKNPINANYSAFTK